MLGRSPRTTARLWRFARFWLERELGVDELFREVLQPLGRIEDMGARESLDRDGPCG